MATRKGGRKVYVEVYPPEGGSSEAAIAVQPGRMLDDLQDLVGGNIETIPDPEDANYLLVLNESGRSMGQPRNVSFPHPRVWYGAHGTVVRMRSRDMK